MSNVDGIQLFLGLLFLLFGAFAVRNYQLGYRGIRLNTKLKNKANLGDEAESWLGIIIYLGVGIILLISGFNLIW
jgi:hypothetical protein